MNLFERKESWGALSHHQSKHSCLPSWTGSLWRQVLPFDLPQNLEQYLAEDEVHQNSCDLI